MIFCINNIMFGFLNSKVSEEKQQVDRQKNNKKIDRKNNKKMD